MQSGRVGPRHVFDLPAKEWERVREMGKGKLAWGTCMAQLSRPQTFSEV